MKERIFALDIGTRSVVGMLLEEDAGIYTLIDYEIIEHDERSMLDGQIHDVVAVAQVIMEVKVKLEEKHGQLHKVCVAAAGRSLQTKRIRMQHSIAERGVLDREQVQHLELSAVQQAQYEIARSKDKSTDYYCVGYSVLHYQLDEQEIGSLIDQQGQEASVEIIATFLPKVVVESLLSALKRSDLEMDALTLEPIAAISVLIPPSMRRLNVALVDIGAGTSDIAITNEGTITAYGMVPKAGDEITEAISDHYLLDFHVAEAAKRDWAEIGTITTMDILGFEQQLEAAQVEQDIGHAVDKLAEAIAESIMQLNAVPPKAVMLVGGGSQTPGLAMRLAKRLELPENRVAIRGTEAIQPLAKTDNVPSGPAFITPIGIALAAKQNPVHYVSILVNGRVIRLFDMKRLTIGDALLAAGIQVARLYGKPGAACMITFQGKPLTLPGTLGQAPTIRLNQQTASLDSAIRDGDKLDVEAGVDGLPPQVTVSDITGDLDPITVFYNGRPYQMKQQLLVNGQPVHPNHQLKDRDEIIMQRTTTIEHFLHEQQLPLPALPDDTEYEVYINDKLMSIDSFSQVFTINEIPARLRDQVNDGDSIRISERRSPTASELLSHLQTENQASLTVEFNGKTLKLTPPAAQLYSGDKPLEYDEQIPSGARLQMRVATDQFIIQDIFRFVDIDLTKISGNFQLYKNGNKASFHDFLSPHDKIELTT
ncbi:pilus assembly protein PilM [Terribacillus saccharophilus]|uniref:Cell division protein n=1 Tax=Terribacillus saccharophilus TaxID=361277 RepID=A0ABX4GU53_9BACI|nr:pilus assembly protein PilM [Terribacillus saccharophilus]PAD33924.1 cell division protein [Terribacillus saccharophilus]PAD94648.1 cell division protein [Terribacillus saccharophilus]PAD98388.1 cell division protein [Terribacillus saccharophilus]